jgi:E3 ubiquitin-protein ligase SHPRH
MTKEVDAITNQVHDAHQVDGLYPMVMKHILRYVSTHAFDQKIKECAQLESQFLHDLFPEMNNFSAVWESHQYVLHAYDEIVQVKTRMELVPENSKQKIDGTEVDFSKTYESELRELVSKNKVSLFAKAFAEAASQKTKLDKSKSSLSFYRSQVVRLNQKNTVCAICHDFFEADCSEPGLQELVLPCCHAYHQVCISLWSKKAKQCPLCKQGFSAADVKEHAQDNTQRGVPRVENSKIIGSWGTKIDALVESLIKITDKNRETLTYDKVIVFSQWTDMLVILSDALGVNQLKHVLCKQKSDFKKGGKISNFKSDLDIQILLLPLQMGAEGLDLCCANHVILLEPLVNGALEAQAINRIDRIGQEKDTHVLKYLCENTIEEKIIRYQQEEKNRLTNSSSSSSSLISPIKKRNKSDMAYIDDFDSLSSILDLSKEG